MPVTLSIATASPPDAIKSIDPLDALQRVAESSDSDFVMLHSGAANGYSVLGCEPKCRVMLDAGGVALVQAGAELTGYLPAQSAISSSPLLALEQIIDAVSFESPHPLVGWLGFLSYDIARFLEAIPASAPDDLHWPLACFTLFRHYLVFDPVSHAVVAYTLSTQDSPSAHDPWRALLSDYAPAASLEASPAELLGCQTAADFCAKVQRIKNYIAAGDIYQANLAQRWTVRSKRRPHDVFRNLCGITPAPYSACIRFHDGHSIRHVTSASPELFLAVQDGRAVTRPIKGTRPRDLQNPARDTALRDELLASTKDHAELTMIVDLLRNDLGRVSEYGSVSVADTRSIEQHPTVWHTVATIISTIRPDVTLAQLLAAMCPGGSITGAPKIRAMQIIEEQEGFRRGLYCGNIGVIGPQGKSIALNIAIRTILQQNDHAYLFAGGGIVADSDPEREYEETLHKAAALFRALGLQPPSPHSPAH